MISGTVCAASLPYYNNGDFLKNENKDKFNKNFDEFIEKIKNIKIPIINTLLFNVKKYIKTYDIDINPSSITTSIIKEESSFSLKKFTFNVLSTHSQPVECYYNLNLDDKSNIFQLELPINLPPNEKQQIMVGIITALSENHPGFKYRYKTTGSMIMYSYLNSNTEIIDQFINNFIPSNLTINCNEKQNQLNPRCVIDNIIPLIQNLQTDIPGFIKEIQNNIESYIPMVISAKYQFLDTLVNNVIQNFTDSLGPNFKSLLENTTLILNYLTNTDCSLYSSGSSNNKEDTLNNKDFEYCREKKRNNLEKIIKLIKPNLKCSTLINNITSKLDNNDIEENIKYILFLLNEMSKNPESFNKELTQVILDVAFCLQDKFDEYWNIANNYLKNIKQYLNSSIILLKKDILYALFQTLTNLPKIMHFEELDEHINGIKTKTGLLISDNAEKIQKKIIEFSKKFNEFGDGIYNLSSSTILKVITNKKLDINSDSEIEILNIPDKDILIKIYANYILRNSNAKYLQILIFDSPLVSLITNLNESEYSDSVNIFVSIILYNDKNEEIPINAIDEKYKPEILYLKDKYQSLKKCFYYNDEKKELDSEGVIIDENYEYNSKNYIKCASSHLTAFTAGTYNFNSNITWWVVLLIIIGILFVLVIFVVIIIIIKKRNKSRISASDIDSLGKTEAKLLY